MNPQKNNRQNGSWTQQQHIQFIQGLLNHGKNWTKIMTCVPTRSGTQIRSHAQKFFNKLQSQFESRAILGKQSEYIMGPPRNQKQYQVFLQIGCISQILMNSSSDIFKKLYYLVKPRGSSKTKQKQLNPVSTDKNTSQEQKYQEKNHSHSPVFSYFSQQPDSISNFSLKTKATTNQSLFSQIILKDWYVNDVPHNFYSTYVDIKFPISSRAQKITASKQKFEPHRNPHQEGSCFMVQDSWNSY